MADVEQRLPVLRAAWLRRKRSVVTQSLLDLRDIAEHERRVQGGRGDGRVERQQPLGTSSGAAGRAANESVDGRVERQRPCLDLLAEHIPRRKPVFARDYGLRIVQRESVREDSSSSRERGQIFEAAQCRETTRLRGVQK